MSVHLADALMDIFGYHRAPADPEPSGYTAEEAWIDTLTVEHWQIVAAVAKGGHHAH